MLVRERHREIMRLLRLHGVVRLAELMTRLGCSESTARRDLAALEALGELRRVHGGATTVEDRLPNGPVVDELRTVALGLRTSRGYRPGSTGTVGLLIPQRGYYWARVLAGAQRAAELTGLRLVLGEAPDPQLEEAVRLRTLLQIDVDALLIAPNLHRLGDNRVLEALQEVDQPLVLLERRVPEAFASRAVDSVVSDHAQGGRLAGRHLLDRRHRRLGMLGWPVSPTYEPVLTGLRAVAAAAGATLSEYGLPWLGRIDHPDHPGLVAEGLAVLREQRVTAVVCQPDEAALYLLAAARTAGLRIPDDLAVITYDDELASDELPLTAVAPAKEDVGFTAVMLCLRRIARLGPSPHATQQIALHPRLVVRSST
ncbi:substrate-binding domain-containing protein [Microlunatus parietis]|uniref:DNA-binding LacI/PurR family transcriptional regulator n=1 Tax=Microlunatus parietis TaxID=682979 RepID=A0A7Y9I6B2_9ACTN|nr:substrate-binding domain-containing protein [Microlunatus parietis]NYE71077.1 DNA-binding LacI/PurR family transcriptional regulator [Microlunatus parietis]